MNKKDNFKRIAEARTNKLLAGIVSLGNLSNTSYYEYSSEQVEKIFSALQEELDKQHAKFSVKEVRVKKFRL